MKNTGALLGPLFRQAKIHYSKALARYRLVPPKSRNGYPERNMTNAISQALGFLQNRSGRNNPYRSWHILVEVPFYDLKKHRDNPKHAPSKRPTINGRLDVLIMTPETWYLVECKQFYLERRMNNEKSGLAADLLRLRDSEVLDSLFGEERFRARPPKRLVEIGLVDCWRKAHVQYLRGIAPHREWGPCFLIQNGFQVAPEIPFDFVKSEDPDFAECDGYWWVWGYRESKWPMK
jgi:hypothetical protein